VALYGSGSISGQNPASQSSSAKSSKICHPSAVVKIILLVCWKSIIQYPIPVCTAGLVGIGHVVKQMQLSSPIMHVPARLTRMNKPFSMRCPHYFHRGFAPASTCNAYGHLRESAEHVWTNSTSEIGSLLIPEIVWISRKIALWRERWICCQLSTSS